MLEIAILLLLLGLGFLLLIKGADWLITGAVSLAKRLGISSFVIGVTLVAFGTSLPELIVNINASLKGFGGVVLGNIVGSNISNILLILGLPAIISPILFKKEAIRKEWLYNLGTVILLIIFLLLGPTISLLNPTNDQATTLTLYRWQGAILLILFIAYLSTFINREREEVIIDENSSPIKIMLLLIVGFLGLFFGSGLVVDNAVALARLLRIPELFISLTIVAFGTSLPELTTVLMAVIKGYDDLSIATILGSNLFNTLLVLGVSALIKPVSASLSAIGSLIILLAATILLAFAVILSGTIYKHYRKIIDSSKPFSFLLAPSLNLRKKKRFNQLFISRIAGIIMFVTYIIFIIYYL